MTNTNTVTVTNNTGVTLVVDTLTGKVTAPNRGVNTPLPMHQLYAFSAAQVAQYKLGADVSHYTMVNGKAVCLDDEAAAQYEAAYKAYTANRSKMVKVHLSSRGWGDYSPLEWHGHMDTDDDVMLREAMEMLQSANDVDNPVQTPEELLSKLEAVRAAKRRELDWYASGSNEVEESDGTCPHCGSYCYGDCQA